MKQVYTIMCLIMAFSSYGQQSANLHFSCYFLDDSTGKNWTPTVYSKKEGKKVLISKQSVTDQYSFDLGPDDKLVLLEEPGYGSINVPVAYHGSFKKASTAKMGFGVSMARKSLNENNLIIYCFPSDFQKGNKYEVNHFRNGVFHCKNSLTRFIESQVSLNVSSNNQFSLASSFQVSVTTAGGETFNLPRFRLKKGINFVDLNIYNQVSPPDPLVAKLQNLWINRPIYFNQSKYELGSEYHAMLDSVAAYLNYKPNSTIDVKGFTDRVGDAKRNTALAEYRAKVVAGYLIKKKVDEKHINLSWEDASLNPIITENESKLKELRKVVITIK